MRSVTIVGLVLAAICYACGTRDAISGDGSQAHTDVGNTSGAAGRAEQAGAAGVGGGAGNSAGRSSGGSAGTGGPSNVGTGGAAETGGSAQTRSTTEIGGSAGDSENAGAGGTVLPQVPYPTGDPAPQPVPPREAGTALLTSTVKQIEQDKEEAATTGCRCNEQLTADQVADCVPHFYTFDAYGGPVGYDRIPPPIFDCIIEILNSTSIGDDTITCRAQAVAELNDCAHTANCDPTDPCRGPFYTVLASCPVIPYDLSAKIAGDCWGETLPAPMVCDDGTRISSTLVCNGTPNCSNGEDERYEYCKH
jgi:hypothetical protein